MITPAKFIGESKLNDFRNNILYKGKLIQLVVYNDGRELFKGVTTGKVCYYLYDKKYNGSTVVTYINGNKKSTLNRDLRGGAGALPNNDMYEVITKIGKVKNVLDLYKGQAFDIRTNDIGDVKSQNTVFALSNLGVISIDKSRINNSNLLDKYKVYISHAMSEHGGEPDKDGRYKIIAKHGILRPYDICTDSYIILATFTNDYEALNYHKYAITKFYRILMSISLGGVYLSAKQFSYVPLQDFTSNSDIDWSLSVSEVDKQLYKKYNLTQEEIDYIERTIKPME